MWCFNLPFGTHVCVCLLSWYFPLSIDKGNIEPQDQFYSIFMKYIILFLISGHLVHLVTLDVSHNNIGSIPRGNLFFPAFISLTLIINAFNSLLIIVN